MSEGINRVIVSGNIGREPDVRATQGGGLVLKFSVAVGERYKDKSGAWQDKTEWVSVVVFGRRAEGLAKLLGKGMPVTVEGKLRTTSYEKDGTKRYSTDVAADTVVLGGSRGAGRPTTERSDFGRDGGGLPMPNQPDAFGFEGNGGDDDIPF